MAILYHQSYPFAFAAGFAAPLAVTPADEFAYQNHDSPGRCQRNQDEAQFLGGYASPVLDSLFLSASSSRMRADLADVGGSFAVDSYAESSDAEGS